MDLIEEYSNQYKWRSWDQAYSLLPDLVDRVVLDLGCGIGKQAADLIDRGAKVIGVDLNEDLLNEARYRCPNNARFINSDFRNLPDSGVRVDGIWSGFSAAYSTEFSPVLNSWKKYLKKDGWIAVTEIDDFFGHEPLKEEVKSILNDYVDYAYKRNRYDFNMGRKLEEYLRNSGFNIIETITLDDKEFSFSGPAPEDVLTAWRTRLDRMLGLQEFCGSRFEYVKNEFLMALATEEHRSLCNVFCCIGKC